MEIRAQQYYPVAEGAKKWLSQLVGYPTLPSERLPHYASNWRGIPSLERVQNILKTWFNITTQVNSSRPRQKKRENSFYFSPFPSVQSKCNLTPRTRWQGSVCCRSTQSQPHHHRPWTGLGCDRISESWTYPAADSAVFGLGRGRECRAQW